ncbi:hypothetical protein, partial [Streptomyces chartreusis]|uniref:hypothetical protein n=1 Tax=Streptomyces chartreusis TaxID=1969 RepID=UPI00380E2952
LDSTPTHLPGASLHLRTACILNGRAQQTGWKTLSDAPVGGGGGDVCGPFAQGRWVTDQVACCSGEGLDVYMMLLVASVVAMAAADAAASGEGAVHSKRLILGQQRRGKA